ncbi:hypothetical protein C1646_761180 [Rhizophagus diaphanus]|nr:hypothetical protein C1646_761180 [Rhizophagus diaphanus] [Rhizophagus sp. MUCL 43196]
MEKIKEIGEYEFTKKIQMDYAASFIKVIKITKNWKVIGYFKDQKLTESAVELSLNKSNTGEIWMVRNKKTIYRNGNKEVKEVKEKEKRAETPEKEIPMPANTEPVTPPGRFFPELGNLASKNQRQKMTDASSYDGERIYLASKITQSMDRDERKKLTERLVEITSPEKLGSYEATRKFLRIPKNVEDHEVVEMINRWRIAGSDDNVNSSEESEEEEEEISEKVTSSKHLKRDNVPTEEVVEIINYMRVEQKMKADIAWDFRETLGLKSDKEWSMVKNNFMLLGHKIISEVEQSEMLKVYTMLNEEFTSRLKDENFSKDDKGLGEKRPIPESSGVEISRRKEDKKTKKKKKKKKNKREEE